MDINKRFQGNIRKHSVTELTKNKIDYFEVSDYPSIKLEKISVN